MSQEKPIYRVMCNQDTAFIVSASGYQEGDDYHPTADAAALLHSILYHMPSQTAQEFRKLYNEYNELLEKAHKTEGTEIHASHLIKIGGFLKRLKQSAENVQINKRVDSDD